MAISIHPPLAGRDTSLKLFKRDIVISIHPPLAGRDAHCACPRSAANISIHPPLAGRDLKQQPSQSNQKNFNPPAPCGAGPPFLYHSFTKIYISIHPPLAGRDTYLRSIRKACCHFNPPAPCGAGLAIRSPTWYPFRISIHPPLAGRDSDLAQKNCAKHRILHKKCIYPGRIERFSGFDAAIFLPNVHKFRCEPSEESLLAPRSHAYTIRTPSG